jgi:methyl-accepting chemotaxis protein
MREALVSPTVFNRRVIALSFWVSLPGVAIVIGFLHTFLRLTADEWSWFFALTAGYGALVTFPMAGMQSRILRPIGVYLKQRAEAEASEDERRAAFSAIMALPMKLALVGGVGWIVPCLLVSILMKFRFDQFGWYDAATLVLAGVAAGFTAGSFMLFMVKREIEEVRSALATEIDDPSVRRDLVRPVSLRAKMIGCVLGLTTIPMVFSVSMSLVTASDALEEFTIRWQHGVLEAVIARIDRQGLPSALRAVLGEDSSLAAPLGVVFLDFETDSSGTGTGLEPPVLLHIKQQRERGIDRGHSATLPSETVFAWRALADGRTLLASTPRSALQLDGTQVWQAFGVLVVVAIAVGAILAWLLSSDASHAIDWLRTNAERMASGDLRLGRVLESEDELGELSRSFEKMAKSIRDTISQVSSAADRVEANAGEIALVSESVAAVTVDQVSGIRQVSASMEAINRQVRGIADSSQALNSSVEESSSSILELGASGHDLNDTAGTLTAKVDEVSTSIEQMGRSVRQVAASTQSLVEASLQTSSSMDEMASSLREVDATADEAARLSREVVASAEIGQARVRQTIEGMDAIRVATETAEEVIRNLGGRTKEIGAIVDVIDDVADETSLLALNAAIIAAQAGEHGKPFSVVAEEIKDLADRVLSSTKEIGSLIRAVQEEGANAIGAIEHGTRSVASGVDLSAEAGLSLEEITRASRDSGQRIQGIVFAVREQVEAASRVVELMERVRGGSEQILNAATEQERGNSVVDGSAATMRDVARQVRATTEEQARGSGRIRGSVEGIRESVERINDALQEQAAACRSAVEFLEEVETRTASNEESARRMDEATKGLQRQSAALRGQVNQFRL